MVQSSERVYDKATEYFVGEELSASAFIDKYALRDIDDNILEKIPDEMHWRLAREFARIERGKFKQPFSEDYIYSLLKDFGPIIPQGSPMYAIGNPQYCSTSNCFVLDSPEDSYGGIHWTDEQLTQICKRRGGVGLDLSKLRPAGALTTNSSRTSSGVISFAKRYSNSIREVGQNGRRGALMLTLSVHHPDIVDFAQAKLDLKEITGANVSIRLSDEFLLQVEQGGEYEQRWPVEGPAKTRRMVDARTVWKKIIHCAWKSAEPGLLFWDRILRESPADCYAEFGYKTESTNPCAELPLSVLDSCRLLLLNYFCFVRNPFRADAHFDFQALYEHAQIAQRLMDDLIDLEVEAVERIIKKIDSDPEHPKLKTREKELWQRVRDNCFNGRRTGTGPTALGDAMAAVGIRYGSDESIAFTDQVYKTMKLGCYRSSVDMAKELGPFPIWDHELEKENPFLLRIKDEDETLWADMKKFGRRNIALLTTAPAGSTSLVAGPRPYFQTTSGIEPLFAEAFTRRKKINASDKHSRVDFIDQTGDRWQEFTVYHPKLRMWMDVTGEKDITKSPYHGCCAEELDWKQRVRLQAAAQRHIDHGISSTINIPENTTEEQVAEIYETGWKAGCKGITVYRKNCRAGVLIDKPTQSAIVPTNAPKRPKELPADIHHFTVAKKPYFVVVGLLGGLPYEVFGSTNCKEDDSLLLSRSKTKGLLRKLKRGNYHILSDDGETNLLEGAAINGLLSDTEEALTRMISAGLRHGVPIQYLLHQLEKSRDGDLHSFSRAISRALKRYVRDGVVISGEACPGCGQDSLVREEGCKKCGCGFMACT